MSTQLSILPKFWWTVVEKSPSHLAVVGDNNSSRLIYAPAIRFSISVTVIAENDALQRDVFCK